MPASLNEIKVRIASTRKTSQITGAMQMVSAAKLTRSEQNAKSFQVYAQKVRSITTDLIGSELSDGSTNPMLIKRPVKKTGYIVITSDKGLVGGYNSSILKSVMQMLKDDHENPDEFVIIALGGMGADFFKARDINVSYELRGISDIDENEATPHHQSFEWHHRRGAASRGGHRPARNRLQIRSRAAHRGQCRHAAHRAQSHRAAQRAARHVHAQADRRH